MTLKLFIWEGDGISEAWHDDGTLVVLAHDADEARKVMIDGRRARERERAAWDVERDAYIDELRASGDIPWQQWHTTDRGRDIMDRLPVFASQWWDGHYDSIKREPDRVVEIDEPKWVAFNGGGYD